MKYYNLPRIISHWDGNISIIFYPIHWSLCRLLSWLVELNGLVHCRPWRPKGSPFSLKALEAFQPWNTMEIYGILLSLATTCSMMWHLKRHVLSVSSFPFSGSHRKFAIFDDFDGLGMPRVYRCQELAGKQRLAFAQMLVAAASPGSLQKRRSCLDDVDSWNVMICNG